MRLRQILCSLLLVGVVVTAQSQPLFETRAVWLTTASGLDWPAGETDPLAQEQSLREIIGRARSKGMNTVFFQIVPRGDAFYRSDRLPWSPILTGSAGVDPGFDPLGVAVQTAHEYGMELHGWINTYRIASMSTGSRTPHHVTETHPEWVENTAENGVWLNPGIPEVNQWIVENVIEIVEKYDLDGVHFDFARYSESRYFRDDSLFVANNPSGIALIEDWRRENINNLMRAIQSAVFAVRPWLKIGSTPIGNYDESCFPGALTGYFDVFQDSRLWLAEGTNDYLAPQLYWADGDTGTPSFTCLVNDWVEGNVSSGHLYPGIALYVPKVVSELSSQIDVTRNNGAQGMAFFREAFTRSEDFNGRFDALSLQPPASRRFEARAPEVPDSVSVTVDGPRLIHVEWTPSAAGALEDPVGWYAIFRRSGSDPDATDASDLAAVVYRNRIAYDDVLPEEETGPVFYSVVAVSRLGFVADPTEPVSTGLLPVGVEPEVPGGTLALDAIYPNPASERIFVRFEAEGRRSAEIRVVDALGRIVWRRSVRAAAGRNLITIPAARLPAGMYLIEIAEKDFKVRGTIVVAR